MAPLADPLALDAWATNEGSAEPAMRLIRELNANTNRLDRFMVEESTALSRLYETVLTDHFEMVMGSSTGLLSKMPRSKLELRKLDRRGNARSQYTAPASASERLSAFRTAEARLDLLKNARPYEAVWSRWRNHLTTVHAWTTGQLDWLDDPANNVLPDGLRYEQLTEAQKTPEALQGLLGLWPTKYEDEQGGRWNTETYAGRFHRMSYDHRNELADIVTRHALGGSTRDRAVKEIAKKLPQYGRYSRGLFHDATIEMERETVNTRATENGYQWFMYMGPDDAVTRPFCRELVDFDGDAAGALADFVTDPTPPGRAHGRAEQPGAR